MYQHMKQQLLTQSVIHADESVVQVLKEDGKPAASECRTWVYASGERSEKPVQAFEYQPDRSGKRPESFLKGFAGCLVTDGYSGYNQVKGITHCGCWAHARRKWRDAMPDGTTEKTSKAAVGYKYCNKFFALDGKLGYPLPKGKYEYRQNVVRPLLEECFAWLNTVHPEKGSKLEDAVRYSLNQKEKLRAFWTTGMCRCPITWQRMRSVRLQSAERTGCSAIRSRVQNPVQSCILWWKRRKPMD